MMDTYCVTCDKKTHYVVKKHKNPLFFSLYLSIMVKDGFNGDSVWRNEYAEVEEASDDI